MLFVPAMWTVWGALLLVFAVLKLYVSRLSRDEDDQLVLDESFDRLRSEQAAIASKVSKIQPIERTVLWVLGAMTLFVLGYYVLDMIHQFS
ncbi:MAG: hypothetical protein WAL45_07170 [Terracidiphilus sp.]